MLCICDAVDEKGKLLALRKMEGYLRQLGPRVAAVSRSLAHLSRLVQSLIQVSTRASVFEAGVTSVCNYLDFR